MRSTFSVAAVITVSFLTTAFGRDLLFVEKLLTYDSYEQTVAESLGFTSTIVSEVEWRSMKTSDFASFKAIIISDTAEDIYGDGRLQFLADTADVWGPAVTGNIIIHGIHIALLYRESDTDLAQALIHRTTTTEAPL
jgi:hypothetical protein